jgi:hypothetical protein
MYGPSRRAPARLACVRRAVVALRPAASRLLPLACGSITRACGRRSRRRVPTEPAAPTATPTTRQVTALSLARAWDMSTFMDIVSIRTTPRISCRRGPRLLIDVRVASRSRSGRVWVEIVTTTDAASRRMIWRVLQRRIRRAPFCGRTCSGRRAARSRHAARARVIASGAGSGHGAGAVSTGAIGMATAGCSPIVLARYRHHARPPLSLSCIEDYENAES